MAYDRLRDEAVERVIDGTLQQVWKDGQLIDVKRVWNDRLLMNMLNHLRPEARPGAMRPQTPDEIADAQGTAVGEQLDNLALLAPPELPRAHLRPAKIRLCIDSVDGVALV